MGKETALDSPDPFLLRARRLCPLGPIGCMGRTGARPGGGGNAIYTSSMPISIHLIGLILQKLTGKPWVADWRDIWVQRASTLALDASFLHRRLYRWLQRTFVHSAAATVAHSEDHADVVRKEVP